MICDHCRRDCDAHFGRVWFGVLKYVCRTCNGAFEAGIASLLPKTS